jgi:glyoxylase-like metal-dependent hydrolase (beta-lactamase superfamily II)
MTSSARLEDVGVTTAMTRIEVPGREIVGLRAGNPGPLTLEGTNTWVIGREPAWVVDPGPDLAAHIDAVAAEVLARGGLGGIALTHDHHDHSEGVAGLLARFPPAPVAAARGAVDEKLRDGSTFGPLLAIATPGHSSDHLTYIVGDVAMTGDTVLGEGSVFVASEPGAMIGYLASLERLRAMHLAFICPGHGPLVTDVDAKLAQYIAHRLDRERRLVESLESGSRTVSDLLDEVWWYVPEVLRPAAAITLASHLDKLAEEGRLPDGVERPEGSVGEPASY